MALQLIGLEDLQRFNTTDFHPNAQGCFYPLRMKPIHVGPFRRIAEEL